MTLNGQCTTCRARGPTRQTLRARPVVHVVANVLKTALTEILTFEVGRSPCDWLPANHNGNLNTEKGGLSVEILPWTQSRAWPFWCPPLQLTLSIWNATSGLAQCITLYKEFCTVNPRRRGRHSGRGSRGGAYAVKGSTSRNPRLGAEAQFVK
ncbi:hypothetical protein Y032_0913g3017 [Ancylostoma ceylanicum]|uniref:Uncharacterized protein n=1 Tax=Ancylostoma ceylanicum TaxID=53326 RepID=A0A016W8U0_9BILA|nr:hypothetical protein Y032_0913g3017 [Ancylostoma ceylanicum]